jgi:chromosomal replication initiation ATPase DnaA
MERCHVALPVERLRQQMGQVIRIEGKKMKGKFNFAKTIFPHDALLIRERVAEEFSVQDVAHWWCSRSRRRNLVEARMVLMYLLRFHCRLGVMETGLYCGRDHSTVVHACQTVEDLRKQVSNRVFNRKLENCERWTEALTGGSPLDAEQHYPQHLRPANWPKEKINETIGYL